MGDKQNQPFQLSFNASRSRLGGRRRQGRCLRNGSEKRQFWALGFSRGRRKGSALKNLAEALHTEAVRRTFIGRPGGQNGNSG